MRSISHNLRRTTQDIDIDFIRYSLTEESIKKFIYNLNCGKELNLNIVGEIDVLKHQDYHGKRGYIRIEDENGDFVESKIDIGVHKNLNIKQEEYCFDICLDENGVNLLMNSKEQMFTEKLRSLLKFGTFSRRYKDIFDLYYLSNKLDKNKLLKCLDTYIFTDPGMKENCIEDIIHRVYTTLNTKKIQNQLKTSKRNWINKDIKQIIDELILFLESLLDESIIIKQK